MPERLDADNARFVGWLLALSAVGWVLIKVSGGYALFTTALMWAPGVAALIVTARRRSIGTLGWEWPATRYLLLGFAIPVLYAGLAYVTLWVTGLVPFDPATTTELAGKMGFSALPQPMAVLTAAAVMGSLGLANYLLPALGEEIGWRGYLTPRLTAQHGFVGGTMLTGLLWAVWHYPLFFMNNAPSVAMLRPLALFTIMVVGISFPYGWLRLRSGSVWPAVLFHAAHNLWIQRLLTPSTGASTRTDLLVDETGLALAVTAALTALVMLQRHSARPWSHSA
jgi:membrane protease YdiL (CAAX protease family)